ncbi:hypothetical protein [Poseidonibacter lekithochrous]|uniref:hypothetical protein n=1 Tax=Poseidonibacter lekithochrous TaxID=1904463 RepID=UPI000D3C4A15|nr:hypothetical protein [Poseidonibacter lekithochrous]
MKKLIIILSLISICFADQYTFLVKKYDKEIELEAKIIANIANSTTKGNIKLFIPKITELEKKIYSKYLEVVDSCDKSNFVFIKNKINKPETCNLTNKVFFTNNYRKLLNKDMYIGAFFWSKSRPNIVFIKNRLDKKEITLPNSYSQFIEDF